MNIKNTIYEQKFYNKIKGYTFTKGTGTLEQLSSIGQGKKAPTVKGDKGPTRTELQFAAASDRAPEGNDEE